MTEEHEPHHGDPCPHCGRSDRPLRYVRRTEAMSRTGLSKRTLQRLEEGAPENGFPVAIALTESSIAYEEAAFERWMASREPARRRAA